MRQIRMYTDNWVFKCRGLVIEGTRGRGRPRKTSSCAEIYKFTTPSPQERIRTRPRWMERCYQEDTVLPMLAWKGR